MVKFEENRVLILEQNGEWITYPINQYKTEYIPIEIYADQKQVFPRGTDNIIKEVGSIIFCYDNHKLEVYMPRRLTDEQLYQLDLAATMSMDDIRYLIAKTPDEKYELIDRVAQKFSEEVIQSYYFDITKQICK